MFWITKAKLFLVKGVQQLSGQNQEHERGTQTKECNRPREGRPWSLCVMCLWPPRGNRKANAGAKKNVAGANWFCGFCTGHPTKTRNAGAKKSAGAQKRTHQCNRTCGSCTPSRELHAFAGAVSRAAPERAAPLASPCRGPFSSSRTRKSGAHAPSDQTSGLSQNGYGWLNNG